MVYQSFMNRFHQNVALFVLRVSLGLLMFSAHGLPKLMKFPSSQFPDPFGLGSSVSMGLAIFAEVFCSILLVLGLWTRLALIPLIITMGVAILDVHAADPFAKKELAVMYLIGYITLFLAGPGKYAVDSRAR